MKKILLCVSWLIIIGLAISVQSCKKDDTNGPEVQTLSVTASSPTKVVFTGSIVSAGKSHPTDYGFIYSTSSTIDETHGTKVSLGSSIPSGQFTKEIDNITAGSVNSYQPTLYARAYLTDAKGTAFGKMISVSLPMVTASSVSPQSGKVGDQITINGQFYTSSASDVTVTFGGVKATVLSVASTKIVVQVPSGISASHGTQVPIYVTVGAEQATVSYSFTILANIKDFSPKSGAIGSTITFTGDNLPSSYYYGSDIKIFFGNTQTSPYYNSSQGLQTGVPISVTSQNLQVSIAINGVTTTLPGQFTVTAPTITSITPASGLAGSYFVVNGTNFPTQYGFGTNPAATLGGTSIYPSIASDTQYSFAIPSGMSPGTYTFTLTVGPFTITAPQKVIVVAPSVASFSPSSGGPGQTVNIKGNFIPSQYYTVYFGSTAVNGTATSATNLQTNVPSGINAGDVKVSVQFGNDQISVPGNFTIIGPSITSFSPSSGVPGTVVTITGSGFDTNYYDTSVKFGTVVSTPISVTANSIQVMVPSNTSTGAMKISVVTNGGQTVTSSDNFTVTN